MDLEKLKTFYHVVNTKSIKKAAKVLSLSKSSVSRQLTSLEEQLGKKLIHWNNHIMTLTSPGEFLFEKSYRKTCKSKPIIFTNQKVFRI